MNKAVRPGNGIYSDTWAEAILSRDTQHHIEAPQRAHSVCSGKELRITWLIKSRVTPKLVLDRVGVSSNQIGGEGFDPSE
jgi:hypothetical protein